MCIVQKKTRDHQTGGLSSLQSHTISPKIPLSVNLANSFQKKSILFKKTAYYLKFINDTPFLGELDYENINIYTKMAMLVFGI